MMGNYEMYLQDYYIYVQPPYNRDVMSQVHLLLYKCIRYLDCSAYLQSRSPMAMLGPQAKSSPTRYLL